MKVDLVIDQAADMVQPKVVITVSKPSRAAHVINSWYRRHVTDTVLVDFVVTAYCRSHIRTPRFDRSHGQGA